MEFVGIDKLSILDYEDYVSVVLFTPACNYRCPFCHNGDSVLNSNETIDFNDILSFLKTRVGLIDAVVISGGEPTLMPELKERIEKIKELGFKIKLDTNGTHPEVLKDLVESNLLDYVAMDIKNSVSEYAKTTGTINPLMDKVIESIEYLKQDHVDYEFRTTLVRGFHTIESIKDITELLNGSKKLYLQKFIDRDGVIQKGLKDVSLETANEFVEILKKDIESVLLRGY